MPDFILDSALEQTAKSVDVLQVILAFFQIDLAGLAETYDLVGGKRARPKSTFLSTAGNLCS